MVFLLIKIEGSSKVFVNFSDLKKLLSFLICIFGI